MIRGQDLSKNVIIIAKYIVYFVNHQTNLLNILEVMSLLRSKNECFCTSSKGSLTFDVCFSLFLSSDLNFILTCTFVSRLLRL